MSNVLFYFIVYSFLASTAQASESVDRIFLEYGESKVICNRVATVSEQKNNPFARKCPFMVCDQIKINNKKYTPLVTNDYTKGDNTFINQVEFVGDDLKIFPVDYSNSKEIISPPSVFEDFRYGTEPKDSLSPEAQNVLFSSKLKFSEEKMQAGRELVCDSKELGKVLSVRKVHLDKFQQSRAKRAIRLLVSGVDILGRQIARLEADDCNKSSSHRIESIKRELNNITKDVINEGKVLTEESVQEIFREVKNMKDLDFSFKKSLNGCEARAHIIADRLARKVIYVGKVWFHGEGQFPNKKRKDFPEANWSYHVAPYVVVKMKDGAYERFVLDPSVTNKAVRVLEFEKSIRPDRYGQPFLTTPDVTPVNYQEWPLLLVSFTDKDTYIIRRGKDIPKDEQMKRALKTLEELSGD